MNAQSVFGLLTSAARFRNIFYEKNVLAVPARRQSAEPRYSCAIRDPRRRSSHSALILCGPIAFLPRLAGKKSGYGAPAPVRLGAHHALSGHQFLWAAAFANGRACRDPHMRSTERAD
jgi:hypothetical protein